MIQLNLVPDVKVEFIKARRSYRIVLFSSIIASLVALTGLTIYYVTVDVIQRHTLNTNISKIQAQSDKISSSPNLNKIVTVQKSLESLPGLYAASPRASNLLTYLVDMASTGIAIGKVDMDYKTGKLTMTVETDNLTDGNVFYNQLQYATYTIAGIPNLVTNKTPVFTGLTSKGLDDTSYADGSSSSSSAGSCSKPLICFTIDGTMATALFAQNVIANTNGIIAVPNENVTHSVCSQPKTDCFVSKVQQ